MTTDTTALQERIAQALCGARFPSRPHPRPTDNPLDYRDARAVLPIVAAEVQAAKAEALREMQEHHERAADKAQTTTARAVHLTIADSARSRATEHEAGDQA